MSRQPLLVISPSPQAPIYSSSHRTFESDIDATPKLPKRERLASFSRLLKSGKLKELFSDESGDSNAQRVLFSEEKATSHSDVSIRISESSPQDKSYQKENQWSPFLQELKSPSFLRGCSSPLSPNLLQVTPLKSPLYTPNRKETYLGRGSFGKVKLFEYKGKRFALKLLRHFQSSVGERNFLGVCHPHLVKIFHVWNIPNNIFICMEFAGHCNLQQLLDTKSDIDFHRRLSFCIQIASGLNHCHKRSIVHGDVKPANVIINPYGICKLGDFGHSLRLKSSQDSIASTDDFVGTAAYAAPELLRGRKPCFASDVFSFGVMLWQVQSREIPYAGMHPHIVIYKVVHYRERPIFHIVPGKAMAIFAETAELCWSEDPANRLEMPEVIRKLLMLPLYSRI